MENKWISRKQLEEDMKKGLFYAKISVKCKHCGHTMFLGRKNKKICTWCRNYVFRNDKEEFMFRMGKLI